MEISQHTHSVPQAADGQSGHAQTGDSNASQSGVLIINADDWGRDTENTDRICDCLLRGTVSSASAMVFMADSERAADAAREHNVDTGLHLNLTIPFSSRSVTAHLSDRHQRIASYLRRDRLAQAVYHPGLVRHFEYVVSSQLQEYERIYGKAPARIDGHHHMHLCANVLFSGVLPAGTIARRNFSFQPGEKTLANLLYRRAVDRILARRHRLTDFFYSLPPIEVAGRVEKIFGLANKYWVEVETHPVNKEEYRYLLGDQVLQLLGSSRIGSFRSLPSKHSAGEKR